jgi:hypothetical protein
MAKSEDRFIKRVVLKYIWIKGRNTEGVKGKSLREGRFKK